MSYKFAIWPDGLVIFFIVMISGLVSLAVWTGTQSQDLVSSGYYEEEIRYQERIDAIARTTREGVAPLISTSPQSGGIELTFARAVSAAHGTVTLYRPSQASLDIVTEIAIDGNGQQSVGNGLESGLWRVRTEWVIGGLQYYAEQPMVLP